MSGNIQNIKVEPCQVIWNGTDLGFTDGDLEISIEEAAVDITAHQEGTNVLDGIRTGKKASLAVTIKETSVAQLTTLLLAGGGSAASAAQVLDITCLADSAGSLNNKFFFIYDEEDNGYCVWLNVNSAGTDPSIPGFTSVPVALATGATNTAVADAVAAAIDALSPFTAPNPAAAVVRVTTVNEGLTNAADAGNSGFTIALVTPGANDLPGWGGSKDFTSQLADSFKLVLHPVVKDADDLTGDVAFWKAYPMVSSIVQSGENPKTVAIEFKVFPDSSKPKAIRLFAYGDHS